MSNLLINEIASEHHMIESCIMGFTTQAKADALYRELMADANVTDECIVMQFASGRYFVVVVPETII